MLLMIDNYDSFTYNLVQYFGELGETVTTIRNDQATLAELIELNPDHVVISQGRAIPIRQELACRSSITLPEKYQSWGSVWAIKQ